jgi:hypothetical protein
LAAVRDAYIVKIDNAVTHILFPFIGGAQDEQSFGLSVDANRNVYISGETIVTNFLAGPSDPLKIRRRSGGCVCSEIGAGYFGLIFHLFGWETIEPTM